MTQEKTKHTQRTHHAHAHTRTNCKKCGQEKLPRKSTNANEDIVTYNETAPPQSDAYGRALLKYIRSSFFHRPLPKAVNLVRLSHSWKKKIKRFLHRTCQGTPFPSPRESTQNRNKKIDSMLAYYK